MFIELHFQGQFSFKLKTYLGKRVGFGFSFPPLFYHFASVENTSYTFARVCKHTNLKNQKHISRVQETLN